MNARILLLALPLTTLALVGCPKDETDDTQSNDTGDTATDDTDTSDGCVAVEWTDGNSGVYTVNSAADDHLKHHFLMPEGMARLVVTTTWDTEWNMKATTGLGGCPHSGTPITDDYNTTGTVTLEVVPGDVEEGAETFTADAQWFSHIELYMLADPPADGSTANYAMEAQVCPPAE